MAYTVQLESFQEFIVKERTTLSGAVLAGASTIRVVSTKGLAVGDPLYIGTLRREGIEKAVVAVVVDETTVDLALPLERAHSAHDAVTAVLADTIRVYRASDLLNKPPTDPEAWTVVAEREIDADQISTYYRDPDGGEGFWYRYTYVKGEGYESQASTPVRGSAYGHYASLREIREEAGFLNALNLPDTTVDLQRRAAEAEINSSLSGAYRTPFEKVPAIIRTLTIKLAAAMLLVQAYGETTANRNLLKDARGAIDSYKNRETVLTDDEGTSLSSGDTVSSWPDESAPRSFRIGDRF